MFQFLWILIYVFKLGMSSYAASVRPRREFGKLPHSSVEVCFSEAIDSVTFLQILKPIANFRFFTDFF